MQGQCQARSLPSSDRLLRFMETKRFEFEHTHTQITDIVMLLVSFRKRKLQKSLLVFDGFCPFSCEASLVTVL